MKKLWKTTLRRKSTSENDTLVQSLFTFSEAASKSYTYRMAKTAPYDWEIISIVMINKE